MRCDCQQQNRKHRHSRSSAERVEPVSQKLFTINRLLTSDLLRVNKVYLKQLTVEVPHQHAGQQSQRSGRAQQAQSDQHLLPAARFLLQPLGVRRRQELSARVPVKVLQGRRGRSLVSCRCYSTTMGAGPKAAVLAQRDGSCISFSHRFLCSNNQFKLHFQLSHFKTRSC